MCCRFFAEEIATGARLQIEATDYGVVETAGSSAVFQTVFTAPSLVISSYSAAATHEHRFADDALALEAFGFLADFDTVEIIDCVLSHQKAAAA